MYPGAYVDTTPDKPAIIQADTGEVRTFAELDSNSRKLARHLRDAGIGVGDDIAFLSDNLPAVFEVYWAGLRSGYYVTGVNHHLTADEAAYILTDCDAKALLVSASHLDKATAVAELVPGLKVLIVLDAETTGEFRSYAEVLASTSDEPLEDQPRGTDMLYSSGTTGRPKGIKSALPDRQVGDPGDTLTALFKQLYGFDENTVYYSAAPTYHAAPLRFGGVVNALGGTIVMATRFDAEQSLAAIEKYQVTHSQWVPTMFVRMLKLPEETRGKYDVSSQEVAIHAAAPCPVEVKARMIDWWGPIIHEYYSSTEANGLTFVDSQTWLDKPGTVGRPALGVVHVCGPDGADVPVGDTGVVYFERDELPFEYHNDPDKTRAAQHPLHPTWTTTGDIGHVDTDGFLYLTDRVAFTIISGGVNIYPQEIESALALHPAILDVAVIGVPDDELGEVVKAVVQPAAGVAPTDELADAILESLRGTVADYKIPRSLDFTDELPRSATGKLVKGLLVAHYQEPDADLTDAPEGDPVTIVDLLGSAEGADIEFEPGRLGLSARTPEL
ncbi:AMP-binding protein [Branchiibius sp. NY16-3462-2]|uniref:AMP-binding protein n=1 Tax=Branchiibius sp. NY16-3462-2 TaxID=1807500 RepID=UPI000A6BE3E8|nr:AMP-binding protein [Branchiibius sp. NY16-3462-2]